MNTATLAALAELEAGFRDLLDGVRGLVTDLIAENAALTARLDEHRRQHIVVGPAPIAAVTLAATDFVPVIDPPILAPAPVSAPVKKTHPQRLVMKPCQRCGETFMLGEKTKFCKPCFSIQARDRIIARKRASADAALLAEVDRHIASGGGAGV